MLSRADFFSLILPPTGMYCVVGLKKDANTRQVLVDTLEELNDYADALVHRGYDVYFALASFTDKTAGRTIANAAQLNSFYLDIDCGLSKPYADQAEGVAALKAFIKVSGVPKPTAIVNSGRGVHAYWVPEQPMDKGVWKPMAEAFKALCATHGLHADPSVTADTARILRIPDTLNFKNLDSPQPVKLLMVGQRVSFERLKELFVSNEMVIPGTAPSRTLDPMTLSLMGNYQSVFKNIMVKSAKGVGCNQMLHIYENQGSIEEPLWRAGLSIAQHCVDAAKAIHKLSNKHPDYNANTTKRKAEQTKGPYTCEVFKKLNAASCVGCTQRITSPIQIGREVIEAPDEPETVEAIEPVTQELRTYTIPKFPFPFFRGAVGGIYRKADPDKDTDKDELIWPYDFYVVKRLQDPEVGECLMMRLHLPKDGVREFIMPLRDVIAKERFIGKIAEYGVAVLGKRQESLMLYTTRWVEELQAMGKAEISRKQFGWLSDDSGFIVGDKEIHADKIEYSPPSAPTLPLVPAFGARGDFHVWKDVINHYRHPGQELRAFAFFMGFGGPLMKHINGGMLNGFLLNLVSREGGTGKSTVLHAINSIYGNPEALLMTYKDTHNFRLQRLGIMQNLTATIDELTNMRPEQMSDLVYDITSGKGRGRMSAKANVERINTTTWKLPVVSTSNKVIRDALLSIKSFPEPELLRILEGHLSIDTTMDAITSKRHFGRLGGNYGHAVTPFIQHCLTNLPEVIHLTNEVSERLDIAAGITGNERFWSAGTAISLAGGIIAGKLGLHDIPVKPVFDHAVELIKNSRRSNKESMFDSEDYLGAFLQRHFHEILVINGTPDKRTGLDMGPIREPRGQLAVRYEPDTNMLFVAVRPFRDDCAKYSMSYDGALAPYMKSGSFQGAKKKRMFAGTVASTSQSVMALCFDAGKLGFFDKDILLNAPDSAIIGED